MENTSYLRADTRIVGLIEIINGLENSVEILRVKVKELDWYKQSDLLEEVVPVLGLALIAFQIYIDKSIEDRGIPTDQKQRYYAHGRKLKIYSRTRTELIIALADIARNAHAVNAETKDILADFALLSPGQDTIESSTVLKGMELLCQDWNLYEMIEKLEIWRESLWFKPDYNLN